MFPYYTVLFKNGCVKDQPENDLSLIDPTKSYFYDILDYSKNYPIIDFRIIFQDKIFGVDLTSGEFFVKDGNSKRIFFNAEPSSSPMNLEGPFELVYFKDVKLVHYVGTGKTEKEIKYRIGWTCNNITQTIIVG